MISVIVKYPGKDPERKDIENTLEALQEIVGGDIQEVPIIDGISMLCNDNGRLLGLEPNCCTGNYSFVGPVILIGTCGEDFTDCGPVTKSLWFTEYHD